MDRAQFMEQLARLLSDISESERQEALEYYESYFDDAGAGQESEVIRELGSPGKVAAIIKADLKESNDRYAEYSELGYEDTRTREPGQMPDKYTQVARTGENRDGSHDENWNESRNENRDESRNERQNERRFGRDRARFEQALGRAGKQFNQAKRKAGESFEKAGSKAQEYSNKARSRAERGYHYEKKRNNAGIILLLIFLVFAAPLIHGAIGGIFGVIITILLLPFLLIFGLGAAALGLIAGAVGTIIPGIISCFGNPAAGILAIGIGCLLMALGILLGVAAVWLALKIIPALVRKFPDFCQRILRKLRRDGENA
ncbi:MAG: DUF1700 domain-containing protein [Blautia sp.]|nr:DUF1700 domain-containing protein [Blautia sp.]MDY4000544.1 DUF1700 domain-containing protein [Blautia sp.]